MICLREEGLLSVFGRLAQAVVAEHDTVGRGRQTFGVEGVVVGRRGSPEGGIASLAGVNAAPGRALAGGFRPLVNELPDFPGEIEFRHRFILP